MALNHSPSKDLNNIVDYVMDDRVKPIVQDEEFQLRMTLVITSGSTAEELAEEGVKYYNDILRKIPMELRKPGRNLIRNIRKKNQNIKNSKLRQKRSSEKREEDAKCIAKLRLQIQKIRTVTRDPRLPQPLKLQQIEHLADENLKLEISI
ncbi:hypothetical protein TrispH2_000859 [Trichoplax sp. H2]|uniref:Uncharacterized protein n=1 Tax=Trichoplax adhaerens TaxID=10228 RepID=B3S7U7_TRIAD|nr:predicted protein [Trichoplax adhaerens]EDV21356.1 predicted protein [Trichoplax adhaerens]RDD47639.1 hypothetical protein TrispH2_000859 [Trichoplax sp. H2]|eukprot:XP_002116323.1 predicted protein [Trichoplax adhaerens]